MAGDFFQFAPQTHDPVFLFESVHFPKDVFHLPPPPKRPFVVDNIDLTKRLRENQITDVCVELLRDLSREVLCPNKLLPVKM